MVSVGGPRFVADIKIFKEYHNHFQAACFSNPRNIFMSTLDAADVDIMKAGKTCVAATRFQYDYLNDDINDFGQIDYTLTNKIPQGLRSAIAEGKKILVLINPPYAEAANTLGNEGEN